ncbi:MAG: hypothetical protein R8G66_13945 [Cytophagales bacterium]|nr:hypothetical protein [Cytophagales bacterium]
MKEQKTAEADEVIDRSGHKWWLKTGMTWGVLMWVAMSILLPMRTSINFSVHFVLINLLICLVCGLIFGFGMKLIKTYLKPPGNKETRVIPED